MCGVFMHAPGVPDVILKDLQQTEEYTSTCVVYISQKDLQLLV